jgi:phosphatidate phosphatase APP1
MDGVLTARVEHRTGLAETQPLSGVKIEYFVDGTKVGAAATDASGMARLMCAVPPTATRFQARADIEGAPVAMEGRLFPWPMDRTVIVCDIDETISMTHYRELVWDMDDRASTAFPGAAATLAGLSKRFGLLYLTGRPGFLMDKTKSWLARNHFPDAPMLTAPTLRQAVAVEQFKGMKIHELERLTKNILIGIGNANTDSEAYAEHGLLPLIIDDHDDNRFRAHAIVLRNWAMVREFFMANRETFEKPDQLRAAIAGERMILRPLIRWEAR